MKLHYSEMDNGIRLINLVGSLDSAGFNSIDLEFTSHCSGDNARILVDLSEVDFIASIGIRMLTINAKSLASRNGKLALFSPIADVKKVLEIAGIPSVIPIYDNLESAEAVVLADSLLHRE